MTVLVFELFGRDSSAGRTMDRFGGKTDDAGRRLRSLGQESAAASRSFNPLEIVLNGVNRALVQNAAAMAKAIPAAGALAGTALTLAPYAAKVAQEIWAVTEAALGAAPALIGMGVVGAAALFTLKMGFSGFGSALASANTPAELEKVNEALAKLHPEARETALAVRSMHPQFEALKRSVQGEIFHDLADGAKAVGDQFITKATPGMVRFGGATNLVLKDLISWSGSLAGVRATEQVTNSMYIGMSRLHPSITRVTSSFGNMIGRIAEVSTAAGASGLGGIMDWLAGRMDRVNAASVSANLADLRNKYDAAKESVGRFIEMIKAGTAFYREHKTEIGLVADVLSVLAIAFGGPVIAVGAAVGLIMRHWDDLKAAKQALTNFFTTDTSILSFMEFIRAAVAVVAPSIVTAFKTIWEAIGPTLTQIIGQIKNELLPALGAFWLAISPIVAIVADVLGPIIASVFGGIVQAISGAISIITGILNVFAGLLTGNWSRMWDGIKQIFSGAWDLIIGLLNVFIFGRIVGILGRLPGLVGGLFGRAGQWAIDAVRGMGAGVERTLSSLIERIPGRLGNVVRLLYEAGRGIVQGLINGILSMINAAGNAMGAVARKIRNMLPFSPAKEGPLSGSGAPDLAGAKIAAMIAKGMIAGVPQVVGAAYQLAGATRLGMPGQGSMLGAGTMAMTGAPGTRGGPVVGFDFTGAAYDKFAALVLEVVRESIKARGGNAQATLGQAN